MVVRSEASYQLFTILVFLTCKWRKYWVLLYGVAKRLNESPRDLSGQLISCLTRILRRELLNKRMMVGERYSVSQHT